jgi:class III poly(R)-hydroxyalkanoic acid synthase PhaC subunit
LDKSRLAKNMMIDININPTKYNITDVFGEVLSSYTQFNLELWNAFTEAYPIWLGTASEYNKSWKNLSELDKVLSTKFRKILDEKFRDQGFVNSLSDIVTSYSKLAKIMRLGETYQHLSNRSSVWNNQFAEPIRDSLYRTPSHKVCRLEKYSLFRYDRPSPSSISTMYQNKNGDNSARIQNQGRSKEAHSSPVLVVYAFINRHYILDLLPQVSVVRTLLSQGDGEEGRELDIFATDWGTPSAYDKSLTLGHFVNNYMDKSVDFIRKTTKSDKVSLLGYCWGGDLALMYAALHPKKVNSLITVATPGDFELDDSLLSVWTKAIKEKYLLDAFGNLPGMVLNAAFILRNPVEYGHKYFHFFEQPRDLESIAEFLATETWLRDSPPIIGEIYREFVEYCYKQNLLIKNRMRIGDTDGVNNNHTTTINLKNINMPFLNIVAEKDDLVAPESSRALNNALTESYDKSLMEFKSGHVDLIIGKRAHKEIWPKVREWIFKHSQ